MTELECQEQFVVCAITFPVFIVAFVLSVAAINVLQYKSRLHLLHSPQFLLVMYFKSLVQQNVFT